MEPIKVQSEGGLNVTLTIRLLMHGKVRVVVFCMVHIISSTLHHSFKAQWNKTLLIFNG
jgi:hypothetical protein